MTALIFTSVSKQFKARSILSSVSIQIAAGSVVGLIGDNGAGKTTLLRLAAGVMRPTTGTVRAFGQDPYRDRRKTGRRIGAILEKPGHYDECSVRRTLTFWYGFYGDDGATSAAVDSALDLHGLRDVANEPVGQLSLGYRHRVALARAVHPAAELVLLDEPFDGLDPRARTDFKGVLRTNGASKRTVVFSSHNLGDVEELCDYVLLLQDGCVERLDNVNALRARATVDKHASLDEVYANVSANRHGLTA
ncbi:MAG: ABC transporter ATP-binding protein [bacterium]